MNDLISRQAAIALMCRALHHNYEEGYAVTQMLELPSAQPTLYGYKIEHLAFIARVMEKENVPPEKVIEIMTDIERVIEMILADAERREDATF